MVDVIICVHNAYEDVKKCVQSVRKCSDMEYRLIVIDDGSEPLTRDFLKSLKEKDETMILLRNDEGHGYTYSANMGIDASEADYLIMLNSDTIVTEKWLSKLILPLIENDALGLTGPLSNAAYWQSIPRCCGLGGDWTCNGIPEGTDINDFGKLVERYLNMGLIFVPSLNGFCLAIKRKVIDTIGKFDIAHFPKGYGEENDFNLRAGENGFKLAIVTSCYIYHSKTKSYNTQTRLDLIENARTILENIYGEKYTKINDIMRNNNLLIELRERARVMAQKEGIAFPTHFPQKMLRAFEKGVYIYGAGRRAIMLTDMLKDEDVDISGYLVTSTKNNPKTFLGNDVRSFADFNEKIKDKDSVTILISVKDHCEEIRRILMNEGYNYVFLPEE